MAGLTTGGSGSDAVGAPWSDVSEPELSLSLLAGTSVPA